MDGGGGGWGGDRGDPNRGNNNNNNNDWFGGNSNWSMDAIFSMKDISEKTRAHLVRVYTTLLTATATCAVGMWINSTFVLQGFMMMMLWIAAFAYGSYQVRNPSISENMQIMWLLSIAFSMGFMVGPGINQIAEVQPELLTQAALYSTGAFGSFSAVALFSQRRSMLFLGGVIMSMGSAMCIYAMCGWLMGGAAFGIGWLMCALFMACMWIIFDTQIIVEEAERGQRNVASHALTLFMDLFRLFIKVLQILQELENSKNKKKK